MEHAILVVKLGGSEGIEFDSFARDVASIVRSGRPVVVVHGGSHATSTLAERLGHPPTFITSPSGHTSRRTDRRTLEILQMACRGVVNQGLVERLQREGVNALGVSGMDGRIWEGTRKDVVRSVEEGRIRLIRDDYTGTIDRVNAPLLHALLNLGLTPVISPPAISVGHEPINVDADRAAARTAAALGAEELLLLSNVPGLLREYPDTSSLVGRVARSEIEAAARWAQGRMKKKVLGAGEALAEGVRRVVIADARRAEPVTRALAGEGTVFQ